MRLRRLTCAAGAFVLLVASAAAQTPAADPISGTWNGYIARDASTRDRIELTFTLTLKDGVVSGSARGPKAAPGTLKSGKFDAATGAVTFDVEVQDSAKTVVGFDGKLAGATIEGRVTIDNRHGVFSLSRESADSAFESVR